MMLVMKMANSNMHTPYKDSNQRSLKSGRKVSSLNIPKCYHGGNHLDVKGNLIAEGQCHGTEQMFLGSQ